MKKELFEEKMTFILRVEGNWVSDYCTKLSEKYAQHFEKEIENVKEIISVEIDYSNYHTTHTFSLNVESIGNDNELYFIGEKEFEKEKFYFDEKYKEEFELIKYYCSHGAGKIDFIYMDKENGFNIVFENGKQLELKETINYVKYCILSRITYLKRKEPINKKYISMHEEELEIILDFEEKLLNAIKYSLIF